MSNYYGKVKNKRFTQNQIPYARPSTSHSRHEYSENVGPHGELHGKAIHGQSEFIRPKVSVPSSCNTFNDAGGSIFNKNKTHKGNKNIMSRVATSVTGIFGKSWWPEWLKGWEGSQDMLDDDLVQTESIPQTSEEVDPHLPGESFIFSQSPSTSNRSPFKHIYPEEGESSNTESLSRVDTFTRGSQGSERPPDIPPLPTEPTFLLSHSDQPIVASTPAISTLLHPRRMKLDSRDFSGETSIGMSPCVHIGQTTNGPLEGLEEDILIEDGFTDETISKRKRLREGLNDTCNSNENTLYTSALEESRNRPNKKPRFASDTLGASVADTSLSQADTSLNDSSYSIFYPGKVMYGGASNYKRSKAQYARSPIPSKLPMRCSPAPSSTSSDGGLSQAAQRILACLDSLSTPLTEAKRIQVNTRDHIGKSLAQSRQSLETSKGNSMMSHLYKHRPRLRAEAGPPANRLLTPNKVKLKENLSRSLAANKEPLSNTMCHDTSPYNLAAAESRLQPTVLTNSVESDRSNLPSRSKAIFARSNSPEDQSKMGRLKSFSCMSEQEMLPEPQKTSIGLQLSSLPKIVFSASSSPSISFPSLPKSNTISTIVSNINSTYSANFSTVSTVSSLKTTSLISSPTSLNFKTSVVSSKPLSVKSADLNFKFSPPIVVEIGDNLKHRDINEEGIGTFSFSPPIQEEKTEVIPLSSGGSESDLKKKLGDWAKKQVPASTTANETKQSTSSSWGAAFLPPKDTWECDACMVRNKSSDSTCISCMTSRAVPKGSEKQSKDESASKQTLPFSQPFQSFGTKFMPSDGEWNCETCLLRNKSNVSKCASCETAKKGSSDAVKLSGFDGKFLPSKGEWECEVCMVRNKPEVINCVSCTTPRKGNFDAKFLPSKDEWECEMCCIRNKPEVVKCISCGTNKKGAQVESTTDSNNGGFKFGVEKSTTALPSSNFTFGASSTSTKSGGFSFGVNESATSTSTFKFGAVTNENVTKSLPNPIKFGLDAAASASSKIVNSVSPLKASSDKSKISSTKETFKKETTGDSVSNNNLSKKTDIEQSKNKPFTFAESQGGSSSDSNKFNSSSFTFGNNASSKTSPTSFILSSSPKLGPSFSFGSTEPRSTVDEVQSKDKSSTQDKQSDGENKALGTMPVFKFGDAEPSKPALFSSAQATIPSFSFGQEKKLSKIEEEKQTASKETSKPNFSFGKTGENSAPTILAFGNTAPSDKAPVATAAIEEKDKPSFVFGQEKAKTMFVFGQKDSSDGKSFSFAQKEPQNNFTAVQKDSSKENASFSFGDSKAPKPAFSFGNKESENASSFSFGGQKEPEKSSTFLFGGQKEPEKTPSFSFGGHKELEKAPSFSFGGQKEADKAPSFSFSQKQSEKAPSFSFGGQKETEKAPVFSFGGQKDTEKAPVFSFGGQKESVEKPALFSFGNTSAGSKKDSPSIFGSTEPKKDIAAFSSSPFGAPIPAFSMPNANAAAAPVFAFGNKGPEKTAEKGFSFGQTAPTFNFGSAGPTNGQTPFLFGQGPEPSQLGAQSTQPPVFGSASAAPNLFNCAPTPTGQSRVIKKAARRGPRK